MTLSGYVPAEIKVLSQLYDTLERRPTEKDVLEDIQTYSKLCEAYLLKSRGRRQCPFMDLYHVVTYRGHLSRLLKRTYNVRILIPMPWQLVNFT